MTPHAKLFAELREKARDAGTEIVSLQFLGYGWPDALIVRGSKFAEVKAPGDTVRAVQAERHRRIIEQGGRIVVVTPENLSEIFEQ